MNGTEQMNRWRLILGKQAKDQISFGDGGWLEGGISCYDLDDALNVIGVKNIVGGLVRDGSYDTLVSSLQSAMGSADSQLWLIQTTIEEKCPN